MSCTLPMLILPKGVPSTREVRRKNATRHSSSVLDSLKAHPAQPGPGDVFRPRGVSGSVCRPLGLIPHREREGVWRELSLMLSSFSNGPKQREYFTSAEGVEEEVSGYQKEIAVRKNDESQENAAQRDPRILAGGRYADSVIFRRQEVQEADLDYIDMLGVCSLQKYALDELTAAGVRPPGPTLPSIPLLASGGQRQPMARLGTMQAKVLQGKLKSPWKFSAAGLEYEYLSFSLQAQLSNRLQHTDVRDSVEYEPCERCRLRGTRCSRCKVIRTGGGYIILDPGNGEHGNVGQDQRGRGTTGIVYEEGKGHIGDREGREALGIGNSSVRLAGHAGDGSYDSGHHGNRDMDGLGGIRQSDHSRGWVGQDHTQHADRGGLSNTSGELDTELDMAKQRKDSAVRDTSGPNDSNSNTGWVGGAGGGSGDRSGRRSREGERGDKDRDGKAIGRKGGRSARLSGSTRPGSSMRRPPSSFRRTGSTLDGHDRMLRNTDFERGVRHGSGRGDGDSDEEDGSGNRKGARRRRRLTGDRDEDDEEDRHLKSTEGQGRFRLGQNGADSDEEEGSQFDLGDLRRFKSKRDNIRAKQCTLKELQGIDPLDYLAKYCIIDQQKLPNYQRVFENVDRDEDDEITIPELDFALKAVNDNLISDAEMTYVHSILELAGRYALNFRLFSLVAALSEKVVSLEAMVKRLINTMDFEALESKMKKCKELFYLLADTNDQEGVVTAVALSVELQAGRLTEEHVDFVVNRLNHDQRGIVEFLDYLTYVPLFMEIHDSISDNPLDFSRTK